MEGKITQNIKAGQSKVEKGIQGGRKTLGIETHPLPAIASTPTVFSALLILLSLQIILAALRRRKGLVRKDAVIA